MAFHGDSDPTHGIFKSRQFLKLGGPKQRPPLDRHTHTQGDGLENPKDYRLLRKKGETEDGVKEKTTDNVCIVAH